MPGSMPEGGGSGGEPEATEESGRTRESRGAPSKGGDARVTNQQWWHTVRLGEEYTKNQCEAQVQGDTPKRRHKAEQASMPPTVETYSTAWDRIQGIQRNANTARAPTKGRRSRAKKTETNLHTPATLRKQRSIAKWLTGEVESTVSDQVQLKLSENTGYCGKLAEREAPSGAVVETKGSVCTGPELFDGSGTGSGGQTGAARPAGRIFSCFIE